MTSIIAEARAAAPLQALSTSPDCRLVVVGGRDVLQVLRVELDAGRGGASAAAAAAAETRPHHSRYDTARPHGRRRRTGSSALLPGAAAAAAADTDTRSQRLFSRAARDLNAEIVANAAKVQSALKLADEDQGTIDKLKGEVEKAWKMVDASKEKETRAKENVQALKKEVADLAKAAAQGGGGGAKQQEQLKDN